ncbi:uncharacterized protein DFL_000698 [Arthrobotrys flagrans]|uniref:Uncharacterized protein n=1 Tax=Arthrobotrys flagrans TaxID=97331 RepID=A0A437AEH1_ARTFL|nr:hypothetical protein DFL_000698 [Arthrobotrys flagrans]
MPQTNGSSASARGQTGERPKINVAEDLDYSKRRYASSPTGTDPWNGLSPGQPRNNDDVFANLEALGLTKKAQSKM